MASTKSVNRLALIFIAFFVVVFMIPTAGALAVTLSGVITDGSGTPISGAQVAMVDNATCNATTNSSGYYALGCLPSSTAFDLQISNTGFAPLFSRSITTSSNISSVNFSLHTPDQISKWGVTTGKGIITGRVRDNANQTGYIQGAVVQCASSLYGGGACPSNYVIKYRDDANNWGTTATFSNGKYFVLNVEDGDTVTVTAIRDGWDFSSGGSVFHTHADSESQGRITGKSTGAVSVSGTVSYSGTSTGVFYIGVVNSPNLMSSSPLYGTMSPEPGAYTIKGVANGTYYVVAVRTTDPNNAQLTDPFGWYGAPDALIIDNIDKSGIDITLVDGTLQNPNPLYNAQLTDEDRIKANFASAIKAYNAKYMDGLMVYFSLSFLDDGKTYEDRKKEFEDNFNSPDFQPMTYTISSVVVNSDTTRLSVNSSNGLFHLIWKKENDGVWRIYGNQQTYGVYAFTGHSRQQGPDSYWVEISVNDPNDSIASVSVTGSGITGIINLVYDTANQEWHSQWDGINMSWNSKPALPLTYTITVTSKSGPQTVFEKTLSGFVDVFAANVSPDAGQTTSGPVVFSWPPLPGNYSYAVELDGPAFNRIWNRMDLMTPYVVYDGPPLLDGSYTFNAQVRDENDNFSMITVPFTYQTGPGISFPGIIQDSSNAAISGAKIELYGDPTLVLNTLSDANGNFTLSGLPSNSRFSVKISETNHLPLYTRNMNSTADIGSSTYNMNTAAEVASWGVTAGKGVIKGRAVDQNVSNLSDVVLSCTSALHPGDCPYTIKYRDDSNTWGTTSTFANGKYFVLNVDDGDVVSVTGTKAGLTFNTRTFLTHADAVSTSSVTGSPGGSISGTISYSGSRNGTVIIGVFTSPNITSGSVPVYSKTLTAPGSYTINNVTNGTYYVGAIIIGSNNNSIVKYTDPYGIYGVDFVADFTPDSVTVNSNDVTKIDFTLADGTVQSPNPFFVPPGNGAISGTISYSGVQTGAIYAGFFTTPLSCTGENQGDPVADMMLPSLGAYSFPYLADGTYYVASVIATGGPDSNFKRTDPYGIYNGCGNITPVVISGGGAVTGIDISLVDGTDLNPNPFSVLLTGDANGDGATTIADALLTARYAAGLSVGTFYSSAADVDCNWNVNIIDALFIARKAAGLSVAKWCSP